MHTQTLTRPDGTRSTYRAAPGSDLFLRLAALKPVKRPRSKADKRAFPKYTPGMSTAEYVRQYYGLNTCSHGKINAYPNHVDHKPFFEPLPDTPAAVYTGVDTMEIDP